MTVKIASAQYPITTHVSFADWQQHTEKWVKNAIDQEASLLLFPEYGSMELVSLFSEDIQQDIQLQVKAMQQLYVDFCTTFTSLAKQFNVTIIAPSFPVTEGDKTYNRACVFSPAGMMGYQDKFFMTRFENEEWKIDTAPKKLHLFETTWGNFGIQICYDVEFAIGSQLLGAHGADLILAPSCTETIRGATRVHIGARARAMENQAYSVVSQTVGDALWSPAVDINYGFAGIYATPDKNFPEEGIIAIQTPQTEGWLIETLDFEKIREVRKDGQVLNYQDHQLLSYQLQGESIEIVRIKIPNHTQIEKLDTRT